MRILTALLAAAGFSASALAQVSPDAGPDQTIAFGATADLAGVLNNRSPLDFWTSDGNYASEDCIVMYRDGVGFTFSPKLHPITGTGVYGWPSDLLNINGQIYGIESSRRFLYTADVLTGACTPIGPANVWKDVYSLAYDPALDRLFAVDLLKKQLLRINRTTGLVTKVGGQTLKGYFLIRSLAFRPSDGKLYAIDQGKNLLLRIDPVTGIPAPVRSWPKLATQRVEELEFYNDELYASLGLMDVNGNLIAGQLQKIDIASGAITNLGPVIPECSPHSLLINSIPESFVWSVQSGPGTAVFSDPKSLTPNVSFSDPGSYVLALTAFPIGAPVSDTVTIDVQ